MLACCSPAASLISRVKRSAETPAAKSGESTLTTTSRSSVVSRATNTRLMPPPPNSRVSVYAAPSVVCSWSCSESVGTGRLWLAGAGGRAKDGQREYTARARGQREETDMLAPRQCRREMARQFSGKSVNPFSAVTRRDNTGPRDHGGLCCFRRIHCRDAEGKRVFR